MSELLERASSGPTIPAEERMVVSLAQDAMQRARHHLLARQHPRGWWQGRLVTSVSVDAEDLMMRQFLGVRGQAQTERTARWIRSQQRADGSWAAFHGGPGDVSTTIEAYVALRLAGDLATASHLQAAAQFVRDRGGIGSSRLVTRIWLALFGQWPWHALPVLPPELMYLPARMPLSVYSVAGWARQAMVPMSILRALRPAHRLDFTVDELRVAPTAPTAPRTRRKLSDRVAAWYERLATGWLGRRLRDHALHRAANWVVGRQEEDGSWGGTHLPWALSLVALHALGYPLDHPVLRRGLAGLERFTVHEETPQGTVRRLDARQAPVWDTALAVTALAEAGLPAEHPALVAAGQWLLGEEVSVRGDWRVRRPGLAAGGWAAPFNSDYYPDADDTATVALALRRAAVPAGGAIRRGMAWLIGMQGRDGGWAACDADLPRRLAVRPPYGGGMTDPPSADVTAHVVEALCREGLARGRAVRRAVNWLLRVQEPGGSWCGRWGVNHVYGTAAVVPALVAAGVAPTDPAVGRAVAWLLAHQNADGGWGEDVRSYHHPDWIGRGNSTASQTAWALLALHAAGLGGGPAAARAVAWLVTTQRPDGGWDEPYYTGVGFGGIPVSHELYRLVFPITALGRMLASIAEPDQPESGTA